MDTMALMWDMYNALSEEDKKAFIESITPKKGASKELEFLKDLILRKPINPRRKKFTCPCCQSARVAKNGKVRGVQRFLCRDCGRTFSYTTNTIIFNSNKSIATWEKFCECYVERLSLRKSAEICGITLHTAFDWKHKIEDALQEIKSQKPLEEKPEDKESASS